MTVQLEAPAATAAPAIPLRHDGASEIARRCIDVTVSAILLVLLSPLMVLSALVVRLNSPGPALFRQTRLGRGGRPFTFYKFRGMYVDARERWPELYAYSYEPCELHTMHFHPEHDPRVTAVGRFLRRTSLDELPNLWNVLKGDMALVGPRPEIPELLPYYGEHAATVLSVRPGVTSLAKVTGRDELTFTETLELDVRYVEERSLRRDLWILGATVVTVVLQHGVLPG